MSIEELRTISLDLPGVTEDIKWDVHLCFNVGGKMFLMTHPDAVPVTASFKTSNEDFEKLQEMPGLQPAAYLGRYKWIATDDIARLEKPEWKRLVKQAYDLVFAKLPAKAKREIENR